MLPDYYCVHFIAGAYCPLTLFLGSTWALKISALCRSLITQCQIPRFRSFRPAANHGDLEAFWLAWQSVHIIALFYCKREREREGDRECWWYTVVDPPAPPAWVIVSLAHSFSISHVAAASSEQGHSQHPALHNPLSWHRPDSGRPASLLSYPLLTWAACGPPITGQTPSRSTLPPSSIWQCLLSLIDKTQTQRCPSTRKGDPHSLGLGGGRVNTQATPALKISNA